MKSTFIFALLALGTLICATKAAPSSSEMQQDDGDMKKLLELIDRAARSQQGYYDEDMALLQDMNELNEQQDDDDIDTNKLLQLLDRAAKSQQFGDDDRAKAQFFGRLLRGAIKHFWN